jgi:hypothetical protein
VLDASPRKVSVHDVTANRRRGAEVLRPDGRLVLVGFTVDDEAPAADPQPYLFSVLMLVWTNEGEVHSVSGYQRMLAESGFGRPDIHRVAPYRCVSSSPSRPVRLIRPQWMVCFG